MNGSIFFNCYLAARRPTLGHSQGGSLTNPILITVSVHIQPEGHQEPCNEVGYLSPTERLAGFEPGIMQWSFEKIKPDSSFSRKLSRYQNSKRLLSLNVIALSNLYMFIRSLQVWHGLESFFCKIAFTLNSWSLCLLGCLTYIIERAITFAIFEK